MFKSQKGSDCRDLLFYLTRIRMYSFFKYFILLWLVACIPLLCPCLNVVFHVVCNGLKKENIGETFLKEKKKDDSLKEK